MLISIPALNDNYIWLYARENLPTIIIDPSDAEPLLDYIHQHKLQLEAILLTHQHQDHLAGLAKLKAEFPYLPVFGSSETQDKGAEYVVNEGKFATENYQIEVLATGGHTAQHISFVIDNHLFCGDTLFSAGCGRVFTGDYEQMFSSLQKIKQLTDDTIICPAHEYTLSNLQFAHSIDPNNEAINRHWAKVRQLRLNHLSTLPTNLALEKSINPFLQVDNLADFIRLRQAKDNF